MARTLELLFEMTSYTDFTTRCWNHQGVPPPCLLWVSLSFTAMVSTSENCQTFIASVIKFLLQSEFNRLDFDWEYPGSHGTPPQDKHLTMILVQLSHVLYHFDWKAYNQSPVKNH